MVHLYWIYPLKMVIFHSYVSLPEGIVRIVQKSFHKKHPQGPDVMYEKIAADTMMEKDGWIPSPMDDGVIFWEVVRISREDYIYVCMILYNYNEVYELCVL